MDYLAIKKISDAVKIPVTIYDTDTNAFQNPDNHLFESFFDTATEALHMLRDTLKDMESMPFLFIEDSLYYYGAASFESETVVFGPVSLEKPDLEARQAFREKHRLSRLPLIVKSSPYRLSAALSLAVYACTGRDIDPDQIQIVNALPHSYEYELEASAAHYALEQSEMDRDHNSSDYENRMIEIVVEGDVEAMEQMMYSAQTLEREHIGQLAADDIKQSEYMVITLITLLSRAAVRGGAGIEEAYSLADIFMQKTAACRASSEMLALGTRATFEFTLLVKKAKDMEKAGGKIDYIENCKSYIAANLRKPFRIGDIAPAIGINRSYLARRFSEVEGITIQQYVTRQRCEQAAKLLIHSDYPISLVAEYFCFSSQSHFGRAFREYSGMTPKEYRSKHKHQ